MTEATSCLLRLPQHPSWVTSPHLSAVTLPNFLLSRLFPLPQEACPRPYSVKSDSAPRPREVSPEPGAAGGAPARGAGPSWRRPRGSPGHKPGRSGAGGEPERDGKGTECARRREAREARRDEARRSDERPGSEDRQTKPEADAAPGALRPGQASVAATASFPEKVAS